MTKYHLGGRHVRGQNAVRQEVAQGRGVAYIELFDAYGLTPRKYEIPDDLDGVAALPFHEVTHDKKKYVFCAAANDTTYGNAVGLLHEIASGALLEKDLTALARSVASKDAKHVKAAAA